jgi:Double zinc ribbon
MLLYDAARRPISIERELARGGEGIVYTLQGQPRALAKVYAPAPRDGQDEKLRWMLAHPPREPGGIQSAHPALAWPQSLLFDGQGHFVGYLMPRVRDAVSVLFVFNPRTRAQALPAFDHRYQHRAARNLAAALSVLHEGNYIIGDLNESNVLVTPSAMVTLIDVDSFQVQEPRNGRIIVYPPHVGKPEYTPWELQGRPLGEVLRQIQHDDFALGVLVFQLLMEGNHPFRARWLRPDDPPPLDERIRQGWFPYDRAWAEIMSPPPGAPALDNLHPELVALIRRCFIEGHRQPNLRPGARDWEKALATAEEDLVQCNAGHIYDRRLAACPRCGSSKAGHPRTAAQAAGSGTANGNGHSRVVGQAASGKTSGATPGQRPANEAQAGSRAVAGPQAAPHSLSPGGGAAGSLGLPDDWLLQVSRRLLATLAARPKPTSTAGQARHLFVRTVAALAGASPAGGPQSPAHYVICVRCGTVSNPDEIYCQSCGTQLAGDRGCPQCSKPIPQNSHFCPHCAARLP